MIIIFNQRYSYCLIKLKIINIDIIKCMYTYLNTDNRIVYIPISVDIYIYIYIYIYMYICISVSPIFPYLYDEQYLRE